MWRDVALVAERDLRIELRSRVATNQVAPFAVLVLVLFAFALDPDTGILRTAAPGLYWVVVLFSSVLAVSRSGALDEADGIHDALRLSGLPPAAVFLGNALAVTAQLLVLELVLLGAIAVLYDAPLAGFTLLPLLLLPVLAPVLIGATKAFEAAFGAEHIAGWDWCGLVFLFAVVYLVAGYLAYGTLLEG